MPLTRPQTEPAADRAVVTNATIRAAERLGLANRSLARNHRVSEANVSRKGAGTYLLKTGDKASLEQYLSRVRRAADRETQRNEREAKERAEADAAEKKPAAK